MKSSHWETRIVHNPEEGWWGFTRVMVEVNASSGVPEPKAVSLVSLRGKYESLQELALQQPYEEAACRPLIIKTSGGWDTNTGRLF